MSERSSKPNSLRRRATAHFRSADCDPPQTGSCGSDQIASVLDLNFATMAPRPAPHRSAVIKTTFAATATPTTPFFALPVFSRMSFPLHCSPTRSTPPSTYDGFGQSMSQRGLIVISEVPQSISLCKDGFGGVLHASGSSATIVSLTEVVRVHAFCQYRCWSSVLDQSLLFSSLPICR